MKNSIRALPTAAIPIALYGLLAGGAQAAPLVLSQSPQATIKEPPPNVVITIDDSVSMGAERLLSNPSISSGRLVRFDTRVPADSVAEGTCATTPPPETGFLSVINGVTGMPANQPVFYSADATLDLRSASRVQYGAGETVSVDTGRRFSIFDLSSVGGPASSRTPPVEINRFSYIPRRIDWRILP